MLRRTLLKWLSFLFCPWGSVPAVPTRQDFEDLYRESMLNAWGPCPFFFGVESVLDSANRMLSRPYASDEDRTTVTAVSYRMFQWICENHDVRYLKQGEACQERFERAYVGRLYDAWFRQGTPEDRSEGVFQGLRDVMLERRDGVYVSLSTRLAWDEYQIFWDGLAKKYGRG